MHVVLLTLMALSGANPVAAQQTAGYVTYPPGAYASGCSSCGSSVCDGASCGYGSSHADRRVNRQLQHYMSGSKHGPMPQTCYAPRFGCYNGNDRHMHRYPAFHGTYYRRPYNYRNLFEYPWHAEMHEPTSYFSYNVPPETMMVPQDAPPLPPADAAARFRNMQAQPQPMAQPVTAPVDDRSASNHPTHNEQNVQYLEPPRMSDNDLAGVSSFEPIATQRTAPAPIESLADATPYDEGNNEPTPTLAKRQPAPAAPSHAPQISARPLSASPVMLRPLAVAEQPQAPKPVAEQTESSRANVEPQTFPQQETSRRSSGYNVAAPQVKAKPISLGQPQSIELKPLAAPKSNVTQAAGEEAKAGEHLVKPTSANQPYFEYNGLRNSSPSATAPNPLR